MRTLHVFPTTDRADEWLATEAAPGETGLGAVLGLKATTLRRLEEALAQSALGGRRRLGRAARSLLVASLLAARELPPYDDVREKRGFRRAVERFFDEVAAGGASFAELLRIAPSLPKGLATRLGALASLGARYRETLDGMGLADPAFALGEACEALEAGADLPPPLAQVDAVLLSGLIDFTPGRLALVRAVANALARRGGRVAIDLPRSERADVGEALDPAWRALEALGAPVELEAAPLPDAPGADVLAFDAADARDEARELARRILGLLERGTAPEQLAVAARGMNELAPVLRDELERAGVPVRDRRGAPLASSITARIALEFARLDAPSAATRERIATLVGSSAIDLRGVFDGAPPPTNMVRHLRAAAVRDRTPDRDGVDGVRSRLERLARAHEVAGDEPEAARVRATADALEALFGSLDAWPRSAPPSRHARALLQLLAALRVPDRLRRIAFDEGPSNASHPGLVGCRQATALAFEQSAWNRLGQLVAELVDASRAVGLARTDMGRGEFASWLDELCNADAIRPATARGASVELLELADLAGRRIEHVFFAGVCDGRLPGPPDQDPLLGDDDRWAINAALRRPVFRVAPAANASSPLPPKQLLQSAYFALGIAAATRSVTLSRPRADERGRPLAPSPLVALAGKVEWERIPFRPLDPRLGTRADGSIAARRAIANARAGWFAERAGDGGAHDGNLGAIRELLAPLHAGSVERPLSAAAIELAANCGFRHFAEKVLRAREVAELDDEAGPLELGKLAHLAAEVAVKAIVAAGEWRVDALESALPRGLAAAVTALEAAERSTVLGHPDLWDIARQKLLGRLQRMLEREIAITAATRSRPHALELPFGMEGAALPPLAVGGVHVAGKIDRVDVGPAGVVVLDYKSGSTDANQRKLRHEDLLATQFQLPVYVAALKAHLPEARGRGVDATYVSLRDSKRSKQLTEALDGEGLDDVLARLDDAVRAVAARIHAGAFAPQPRTCQGCGLRPVCRIPRPEGRS